MVDLLLICVCVVVWLISRTRLMPGLSIIAIIQLYTLLTGFSLFFRGVYGWLGLLGWLVVWWFFCDVTSEVFGRRPPREDDPKE